MIADPIKSSLQRYKKIITKKSCVIFWPMSITGRIIQLTNDGSHTISIPELNITYHSKYGAIGESLHVFIKNGLQNFVQQNKNTGPTRVFEVGFGSGLNALLSLQQAIQLDRKIFYQTIEPYPLSIKEVDKLNYVSLINKD